MAFVTVEILKSNVAVTFVWTVINDQKCMAHTVWAINQELSQQPEFHHIWKRFRHDCDNKQ